MKCSRIRAEGEHEAEAALQECMSISDELEETEKKLKAKEAAGEEESAKHDKELSEAKAAYEKLKDEYDEKDREKKALQSQVVSLEAALAKLKVDNEINHDKWDEEWKAKMEELQTSHNEQEREAYEAQLKTLKILLAAEQSKLLQQKEECKKEKVDMTSSYKEKLKARDEKQTDRIIKLETLKVEEIGAWETKYAEFEKSSDEKFKKQDSDWKERMSKNHEQDEDASKLLQAEIIKLKAESEADTVESEKQLAAKLGAQEAEWKSKLEKLRQQKDFEILELDSLVSQLKKAKAEAMASETAKMASQLIHLKEMHAVETQALEAARDDEIEKKKKAEEDYGEKQASLEKEKLEAFKDKEDQP